MTQPQLKMNWPTDRGIATSVDVAHGYVLRQCRTDDQADFVSLMHDCGWADWDDERLRYCKSRLIPDGWFLAIDQPSGDIVGSAMALHNYSGKSPCSGTVGWVGCSPSHRGKRLGMSVTAAVVTRLRGAGYREIELYTEHFRLPALTTYFKLGFVPYLYNDAVAKVWEDVCEQLEVAFTPKDWPSGNNAFPSH